LPLPRVTNNSKKSRIDPFLDVQQDQLPVSVDKEVVKTAFVALSFVFLSRVPWRMRTGSVIREEVGYKSTPLQSVW
jgi:hypothetical protein